LADDGKEGARGGFDQLDEDGSTKGTNGRTDNAEIPNSLT
jgi:hypothetical protein